MTSLTVRRKSCILAATSRAREQAGKVNFKKREISWRKAENSQVTIFSLCPCLQLKSCKCLCSAVSLNICDGLDFTNFAFYPLSQVQVAPWKILCSNIWEAQEHFNDHLFQLPSFKPNSQNSVLNKKISRETLNVPKLVTHYCHCYPCLAGAQVLSCNMLYTAR